MPLSRYYKILDLPIGASEREIRKKYRLLAMKFHPDRNPDPLAEEVFIRLTDAYEVLLGKRSPDGKSTVPKKTTEEERKERVKVARQRYTEQILREHLENEHYFNYLTKGRKWNTIRVSAFLGILFSLFILLDFMLPHHFEKDRVSHYKRKVAHGITGKPVGLIKTQKNNYFWISKIPYSMYRKTGNIYIESSWIFHNPIRVISVDKIEYKYFYPQFTFYSGAWILIILFLLPSFTMLYKRKRTSFTVLYYSCYYGISSLLIIYLITGDRWAHVLSLGFI
jgi:DnaJ domain